MHIYSRLALGPWPAPNMSLEYRKEDQTYWGLLDTYNCIINSWHHSKFNCEN